LLAISASVRLVPVLHWVIHWPKSGYSLAEILVSEVILECPPHGQLLRDEPHCPRLGTHSMNECYRWRCNSVHVDPSPRRRTSMGANFTSANFPATSAARAASLQSMT